TGRAPTSSSTPSLHDALPILGERGFVLSPTYRLVAGRAEVHLHAVLECGEPPSSSTIGSHPTSSSPASRPTRSGGSSRPRASPRSEEHTPELQSRGHLVCPLP